MTNLPPPPAHVEPFVRVLGTEGAIEFLLTFGGAELYWAADPKGRSELAQLVGMEKARALGQAAEFLPRRIPTAKPWIATVWAAQGLSKAKIARRLHVADKTVRAWLKRGPNRVAADSRQMRLF